MNIYLVSYDLIRPVKNYAAIHEHLRSYSNWAKPLESVWLINSTLTAIEVRDAAQAHMDDNDKVFVVDVTHASWATRNVSEDVNTWIKNNL